MDQPGGRGGTTWHSALSEEEQEEAQVVSVLTRIPSFTFSASRSLQVVTLAGQPLSAKDLSQVLEASPFLFKLDASRCELRSLPPAEVWSGLRYLSVLALHRNEVRQWEDLSAALSSPSLLWPTFFRNPIASHPQYRKYVVGLRPKLLALDFHVVTDAERLDQLFESWHAARPRRVLITDAEPSPVAHRFSVQVAQVQPWKDWSNGESEVERDMVAAEDTAEDINALNIQQLKIDLRELQHQSNRVSAACCIQTTWRGCMGRWEQRRQREMVARAACLIQKRARSFLWRKGVHGYLRSYLEEHGKLELLMDAKEMLRERARDRIAYHMGIWLNRRKMAKQQKNAASLIGRAGKSTVVGWRMFNESMDLQARSKIYFPTRVSWEFLICANMVLRKHRHELLPLDHVFEQSEYVAIRMASPDELSDRRTALLTVGAMSGRCLIRPRRAGRFPDRPWDGPVHRLLDSYAPEALQKAHDKLQRRSAHVDSRCKRCFKQSCCPGLHPVDVEDENDYSESRALRDFLDSPESEWPALARCGQRQLQPNFLYEFLQEVKLTGVKRWRPLGGTGTEMDPNQIRVYRNSRFLNEQLKCYSCASARIAREIMVNLMRFSKAKAEVGSGVPSLEQVPFLPEKFVARASAATVIQASWLARRARKTLPCGLLTAKVVRRAALLIQSGWRWSRLRRRLALLAGALRVVKAVRSPCLYIEERLFNALNVINSVDRYPPLVTERGLGFGYSTKLNEMVLVNLQDRQKPSRTATNRVSSTTSPGKRSSIFGKGSGNGVQSRPPRSKSNTDTEADQDEAERSGLPLWFYKYLGFNFETFGAKRGDELKTVAGLRGLLVEGLGLAERTEEEPLVEAKFPTLKYLAAQMDDDDDSEKAKAIRAATAGIEASDGAVRFLELRYPSVQAAQMRALAVFMCTFNCTTGAYVPLLPRSALQDWQICCTVLATWQIYGLDWPTERGQVAMYQLRQRASISAEVVPFTGVQSLSQVVRREWTATEHTDSADWSKIRKANREESTRKRFESFARHIEAWKNREHEQLQERLDELSSQEALQSALEAGPTGTSDVVVRGAIPPTTPHRIMEEPAAVTRADRDAARTLAANAAAQRLEDRRALHDQVARSQSDVLGCREFERRLMDFYGKVERDKIEARQARTVMDRERRDAMKAEERRALQMASTADVRPGTRDAQALKFAENHVAAAQAEDMYDRWLFHEEERRRQQEKVRQRAAEEKAKVAKRKEAAKTIAMFQKKRVAVERYAKAQATAEARRQDASQASSAKAARQQEWAIRAEELVERRERTVARQRQQARELKQHLAAVHDLQTACVEEELRMKRDTIERHKALDSLSKAAQNALSSFLRGVSSSTSETSSEILTRDIPDANFRKAVVAVHDLADALDESEQSTQRERQASVVPTLPAVPAKTRQAPPAAGGMLDISAKASVRFSVEEAFEKPGAVGTPSPPLPATGYPRGAAGVPAPPGGPQAAPLSARAATSLADAWRRKLTSHVPLPPISART